MNLISTYNEYRRDCIGSVPAALPPPIPCATRCCMF
jgi:hypothetical protein